MRLSSSYPSLQFFFSSYCIEYRASWMIQCRSFTSFRLTGKGLLRIISQKLLLPPLESRDLPDSHLAEKPTRILGSEGSIDDHLHLFESAVSTDEFSLLIAERTIFGWFCSIFFCSASFRIFFDGHPTGLALDLMHWFESAEEIFHEDTIRKYKIYYIRLASRRKFFTVSSFGGSSMRYSTTSV